MSVTVSTKFNIRELTPETLVFSFSFFERLGYIGSIEEHATLFSLRDFVSYLTTFDPELTYDKASRRIKHLDAFCQKTYKSKYFDSSVAFDVLMAIFDKQLDTVANSKEFERAMVEAKLIAADPISYCDARACKWHKSYLLCNYDKERFTAEQWAAWEEAETWARAQRAAEAAETEATPVETTTETATTETPKAPFSVELAKRVQTVANGTFHWMLNELNELKAKDEYAYKLVTDGAAFVYNKPEILSDIHQGSGGANEFYCDRIIKDMYAYMEDEEWGQGCKPSVLVEGFRAVYDALPEEWKPTNSQKQHRMPIRPRALPNVVVALVDYHEERGCIFAYDDVLKLYKEALTIAWCCIDVDVECMTPEQLRSECASFYSIHCMYMCPSDLEGHDEELRDYMDEVARLFYGQYRQGRIAFPVDPIGLTVRINEAQAAMQADLLEEHEAPAEGVEEIRDPSYDPILEARLEREMGLSEEDKDAGFVYDPEYGSFPFTHFDDKGEPIIHTPDSELVVPSTEQASA